MNQTHALPSAQPKRAPLTSPRWDPLTTTPKSIGNTGYAVAGTEFGKLTVIDREAGLAVARYHVHLAPVSAVA